MNTPHPPPGQPSSGPTPPRLARAIARGMASTDDRELLLADLDDRFRAIAERSGERTARRWYWSQVLRGAFAPLSPDVDAARRRSFGGLAGDVRQGMRTVRRRPLYAFGVTGTLAVGLASAAVVLSIAWHIWLAPMPFPDPDRVVRLLELEPPDDQAPDAERTRWRLSPPLMEDLRTADWETIEAVSGVSNNVLDWVRDEETTRLTALVASPEFFEILGVAPAVGRVLSDDEDAAEVVLTEAFFARAFGSDRSVVEGTSMMLRGSPYRIVGVVELPVGYPGDADVIVDFDLGPGDLAEGMRGARYLDVVARVAPGRSVADASAEMDRRISALGSVYGNHAGWGGVAVGLTDELLRPYRPVLALLLAAGVVFLLLAVVNVAGLVAARTVERRSDRAVRLALGASERRLLRGSVVESGILGAFGAVAALAGASLLMGPIRALIPPDIPRAGNVALDAPVMAVVVAIALLAGWAVGLSGYVLSRGQGPSRGRSASTMEGRPRGQSLIVASQVALTTLLGIAGVGILRHVVTLQRVDLGFEPDGVVSTQAMLTGERYPSPEARLVLWRDLLADLDGRGLDAAIGTSPPMAGVNMPWGYRRDAAAEQVFAQYHIVSPGYFDVMGVDLVEGRLFDVDDREGAMPVIVVNEAMAEETFPGESAVGRQIVLLDQATTIVGVVEGARHFGPSTDVPTEIYAPFGQDPWPHAQILVRGDAAEVGSIVADAADRADPLLRLPPVASYDRFVAEWFAALRLQLIIVGVLGVVGTAMAMMGLYALVAFRVSARRREIGVRMALGATDARMFSDVIRQGVVLAALGVLAGIGVWYAALPAARRLVGDIDVADPMISVIVAVVVGLVAAAASVVPAARSIRIDPAVTLRAE